MSVGQCINPVERKYPQSHRSGGAEQDIFSNEQKRTIRTDVNKKSCISLFKNS